MKIAIIAEHDGQQLKSSTRNAITAAQAFGEGATLVISGHNPQALVEQAQALKGIGAIIAINHPRFAHPVAEDLCQALMPVLSSFDVVLAAASTFGKNLLPRLAAKLDVNAYADVINIDSQDIFLRPVYAGNVLQLVKALDNKKVLTIRPTAFKACDLVEGQQLPVEAIDAELGEALNQFETAQMSQSERPELTEAKIIVSGGRGLQSAEKFKLVEELADKLGAAVGASRAAVDAGFVANDMQVGQTGKVVAPELYIALGISGAIQHLAGMKDSKVIVAINKDPEAPIFQIASYGLVGDLFELVPELMRKIS